MASYPAALGQAYLDFAETYLRLGDEYLKYGHRDHALEIWHRGAAQFPEDSALWAKRSAP